MIAEIGHFALTLATVLSSVQSFMGLSSRYLAKGSHAYSMCGLAISQSVAVIYAFVALEACFVIQDFSVLSVAMTSAKNYSTLYRLMAGWGSQEGSPLLFLAVIGAYQIGLSFISDRVLPQKITVLGVTGAISSPFYWCCLLQVNPFLRLWPMPSQGVGLNPLLQDLAQSFHPPLLFLGYGGLILLFLGR